MYPLDKIKNYLRKNLDSAKFKHSLGVAGMCRVLAEKYNTDADKAYTAGLLHDCGRVLSVKDYAGFLKKHNIKINSNENIFHLNPFLLHGIVGARIAGAEFGIKDRDILRSISGHTLARKTVSELEKIVYIADMIAPDRRFPWVAKLRKTAFRNLDRALIYALEIKISTVLKKKKQIYPGTVLLWNELLQKN